MKRKISFKHLRIIGALMAPLLIYSCTDSAEQPSAEEISESQEESSMASSFDEVIDLSFAGILQTANSGGRIENDGRLSCATVNVVEEPAGVFTLTIDFGDGCTGPAGITRKGIIQVVHDGNIWMQGSQLTISLTNYSVNGIGIEGLRTVTNVTTQDSQGVVHTITVTDGKIVWGPEDFATRNVSKTRTWIRNQTSPSLDELRFTGTASGTNRRGHSYTRTVLETIVYKKECLSDKITVPVSGIMEVITERKKVQINFGDGTCDREAVVTGSKGGNSTVTIGG